MDRFFHAELTVRYHFDILAGVLRTSSKYEVDGFRKTATHILTREFPTTLAAFDALPSWTVAQTLAADVVKLARQASVPQPLPCALYLLATLEVSEIFGKMMTYDDLCICLVGREKLCAAKRTITHACLFTSPNQPKYAQCQSNTDCAFQATVDCLDFHRDGWFNRPTCLSRGFAWEMLETHHVCAKCVAHFKEENAQGRQKVWDLLPEYFELGSWEEILKEV
jgi:hypothetical protein